MFSWGERCEQMLQPRVWRVGLEDGAAWGEEGPELCKSVGGSGTPTEPGGRDVRLGPSRKAAGSPWPWQWWRGRGGVAEAAWGVGQLQRSTASGLREGRSLCHSSLLPSCPLLVLHLSPGSWGAPPPSPHMSSFLLPDTVTTTRLRSRTRRRHVPGLPGAPLQAGLARTRGLWGLVSCGPVCRAAVAPAPASQGTPVSLRPACPRVTGAPRTAQPFAGRAQHAPRARGSGAAGIARSGRWASAPLVPCPRLWPVLRSSPGAP